MNTLQNSAELSPNKRTVLMLLAFVGAFQPTPIPLTFLHKFYVGQYGWGFLYFVLGFTQISRVACALEGCWYLVSGRSEPWTVVWPRLKMTDPQLFSIFQRSSKSASLSVPENTHHLADAIRALEQLRQEGLLSEYEFEQKRRLLLDQMS